MTRNLRVVAALVASACIPVHAADVFAPPGAKATLTVEYLYESSGRKKSEGAYDPYEWRVKRSVILSADLAAQPPTAMPTVQAIDSAQMASLQGKTAKAQAIGTSMAPMMADAQQIMARCGDNEACITREVQKMGAAMQGTPKMEAAMNARKDAQELARPDGNRYQSWRPTGQKGTYSIEEAVKISVTDPICLRKPSKRCARSETRTGSGEVPVPGGSRTAGVSAVELDGAKGTITLALPVPLQPLPYTETIVSDEPEGTHDTPVPKGPQARQMLFRVNAAGKVHHEKPLTVALKGGWRSQSGEEVVTLKGALREEGKLTIRWRFVAH
jgi:hypothetical protein